MLPAQQITDWNGNVSVKVRTDESWHLLWIQCNILGRKFPVLTPVKDLADYIRGRIRNFYGHYSDRGRPIRKLVQAFNGSEAMIAAQKVRRKRGWRWVSLCKATIGSRCPHCAKLCGRTTSVYEGDRHYLIFHYNPERVRKETLR